MRHSGPIEYYKKCNEIKNLICNFYKNKYWPARRVTLFNVPSLDI